jgi:outer membrane protein TolC
MIRKILSILIILVYLLVLGFSQEKKILTFSDALNIALQNNRDLLVAKINLQNAENDYNDKKADPTTLILSLKQSELNLKLERVRFNNTKLQIIQSVRNSYFNVLEAQSQLRLLEKQVVLAQEQLQATQNKYKLSNATLLDVQQAEINLLSAQNNYKLGESNLKTAWSQFWETLGVKPMDVILQELPLTTFDLKLDDLVSIAKENLTTLVQLQNNIELYDLQVKLYDNDYTPKSQLRSAQSSLESAKTNFEQTLANTIITIAQRLDQLINNLEKVKIQEKSLQVAQENYKIDKLRLDAGLITKIQLLNTEINLIKAENDYYSALHNYWKSIDSLSLAIGKSIEEGGK